MARSLDGPTLTHLSSPEPTSEDADWPRVKAVFQGALDRPTTQRTAYLDAACAGDDALRREVESLLGAHDDAGGFLSRPALPPDAMDAAGRRIGPYRVLGRIGHGGMGVVYRCVRDDDVFQKTVALKVVHGGAGGEHLLRLAHERQVLARLQHPNIATILDGGSTEDGQPYMVMEYVPGEPIDAYCVSHGLDTRARLEMFRTVCSAVHYAHQNLVVHRDLKPQNILVNADGLPKLLDFGIAKLLAAGVDPLDAPTATLLPMMTPDYASPEQVRGAAVTTASDVYSLGVLLYELLTGSRPYSVQTDSLEGIVRTVCEAEPPAPSQAAGARGAELRGDLDTIVLKALRKEPERRYLSAQEMAEDVRRHLEGLPVLARKDTIRYRVAKFVGRHRVGVGAAVLVAASLVGGLLMTLRQARIAEANRLRAERRFDEGRRLARFVMTDMNDAIGRLPGATPARKRLVEKAVEYLDGVAADAADDAGLRAELAAGYERLGRVQGDRRWANLADGKGALASLRKAVALREQVRDLRPAGDPEAAAALANAYAALTDLLRQNGLRDEAVAARGRMKAALDAVPPSAADELEVLGAWARYYDIAAGAAAAARELEGARENRHRQVEMAERVLARQPSDVDRQRNVALACKYYGAVLQEMGDFAGARPQFDRALALDLQGVAAEPLNASRRLDLSFSHASLGWLLRATGDFDGALAAYREALRLRDEVFAADPANEFAFTAVTRAHRSLADVFASRGQLEPAIEQERAILRLRVAWEASHPSAHGRPALEAGSAEAIGNVAAFMASSPHTAEERRRGYWRRARTEYARALASWLDVQARRPLEGDDAKGPDRLRQALARCDAALAGR